VELFGDLALFLSCFGYAVDDPLFLADVGALRFDLRLAGTTVEIWRRSWDKHYLIFFNSASQAVSGIMVLFPWGHPFDPV